MHLRRLAQARVVAAYEGPFAAALAELQVQADRCQDGGVRKIDALMGDLAAARRDMAVIMALAWVLCLIAMIGISAVMAQRLNRRFSHLILRTDLLSTGEIGKTELLDTGTDELSRMSDTLEIVRHALIERANLEEATASIQELTASVNTADGSFKVSVPVASRSTEVTRAGQTTVAPMAEAMSDIKEASGQIAKVTDLNEDIAFRTYPVA